MKNKKLLIGCFSFLLSLAILLPSFSSVKADDGDLAEIYPHSSGSSTFTYGGYNWVYGQTFTAQNVFSQALKVHVELNNYYKGSFVITISGVSNFANVGIVVDGGYIQTSSLNQVKVSVQIEKSFDVYFFSTNSVLFNGTWTCTVAKDSATTLTSYSTNEAYLKTISTAITNSTYGLQQIYNKLDSMNTALQLIANAQNYISYQIPRETLPAWLLFSPNFNDVVYSPGDIYPYFPFTSGHQSRTFRLDAGETEELYVFASTDWSAHLTNSNFSYAVERIESYKISGYSLYHISLGNLTSQSATTKIQMDYSGNMIPIYYGKGDNLTEELRSLLDVDDPSISLLTDILGAIQDLTTGGGFGLTLVGFDIDPTLELHFEADVDLYIDAEDDILSGFTGFTNGWLPIGPDSNTKAKWTWLKYKLTDIYNATYSVGDMWWVFNLPIILGVISLFIGRK